MNTEAKRTMGNSPKSVEARVGVVFGLAGLDCKFIGELGVSKGKTHVFAAARNVDIKQILEKFKIDLPHELNGLSLLIETLYLNFDTNGKQELLCKIELKKKRVISKNQLVNTLKKKNIDKNKIDEIWTKLCSKEWITEYEKDKVIVSKETSDDWLDDELNPYKNDIKNILFPQITLGSTKLPLASLEFKLIEKKDEFLEVSFNLHGNFENGKGTALGNDDVTVKNFDLKFAYSKKKDKASEWVLKGSIEILVFERDFKLSASYQRINGRNLIQLKTKIDESSKALLEIPNIAALKIVELTLSIETAKDSAAKWEFSAEGGLKIGEFPYFKGILTLGYEAEVSRFKFVPEPKHARVSIPILKNPPLTGKTVAAITLSFGDILLEYGKEGLKFESSVALVCEAFQNALPEEVRKVFPEEIKSRFVATSDGVSLSVDRILNPLDIPLPPIALAKNVEITLGDMRLDASDFKMKLEQDKAEVSMNLGFGIPSLLNHNFGTKTVDEKEVPQLKFFKTFDKEKPKETTIRLNLAVGTDGLGVALLNSPVDFIEFEEKDGKVWCNLDFRDCGAVRFQVPHFKLDLATGSFTTRGVFEARDLALPVSLVKKLMEGMGLKDAAALLPDSLPLMDISILDEKDELDVQQLIDMIETSLKIDIPPEVEAAIKAVGELINNLPDDLRKYFRIRIPRSFSFDIAITPDGGVKFKAGVKEGDDPIRILYPVLGPLGIALQGLEFRSIAFGEVLFGSLMLLELDARIDDFDLVAIGAAMLAKDNPAAPLTHPTKLQRRLIIDELFMLIVYQTVIPIPVPIFFKELGIEYKGLEGTTLQTHIGFPMPKANLGDLGKVLADLINFVRDPESELDPQALGEMDPRLILGPNYIELSKYLGGAVIGTKKGKVLPGAYCILATILNNLKRFSLVKMIKVIPIEHRIGHEKVSLGPLSAEAAWLLTTPTEFRQGVITRLGAPLDETEAFMAVLPHVSRDVKLLPAPSESQKEKEEEGLVLFLKGGWGIKNVLNSEVVFGLVASATMGFHTGFKIRGDLLNLLDMEISGRVAINKNKALETAEAPELRPPSVAVEFNGKDDYVALPALDAYFSDGITIEAWVYFDGFNRFSRILDIGNGNADNNIVLSNYGNENSLFFCVYKNADRQFLKVENVFEINRWAHVAVCMSRSGSVQVFKNGESVTNGTAKIHLPPNVRRRSNYIGKSNWEGDEYLSGKITGVRIWNKALENQTVRARMNKRLNGTETSLIGCWPFGDGRNEQSQGIFWRNKTVINGPKWQRKARKPRIDLTGLRFNGKNSYISIKDPFPNHEAFTISLWLKPDQLNDGRYHGIMGKEPSNGQYRKPGLWLASRDGGLQYDSYSQSGERFTAVLKHFFQEPGEWVNVAWVKKGQDYIFYRNGVEFDREDRPAPNKFCTDTSNYFIGKIDTCWKGLIDNVQIWDYALRAGEIKTKSNLPLTGFEPGLVSYLPFEEGYGNATLDFARHTKTRLYSAKWEKARPLELNGLRFNDTDSYVEIPAATIPTGNEITFSLWAFGGDELPNESSIIEAVSADGNRLLNVHLPWKNENVYFDSGNDGASRVGDRISKKASPGEYRGDWTHWAFTKNAAAGEMKIYRNGELWHCNEPSDPKTFPLPAATAVKIGSYADGSHSYAGKIAEVRIWKKARTIEQIRDDMQRALSGTQKDLMGYWPFFEGQGDKGFDLAGDNNAAVKNTEWAEPSRFELLGLTFDGKDDYVDLGPGLRIGSYFTIEAWVNGRGGTIFQRDGDHLSKGHVELDFNNLFRFVDTQGACHSFTYNGLPYNQWALVAASYDGKVMKVYVNGEVVAAKAVEARLAASDAPSVIGKRLGDSQGSRFRGLMDDVRVWRYARKAQEIKREMFRRLTGNEAGLAGYWPFISGQGLRAFDYAQRNNGILCGPKWALAHQLRLAGHHFNGKEDFMEVAEPFGNSESFTISLWVNPDRINDGAYHGMLGKEAVGKQQRKPGLWLTPRDGGLLYDSYSHAGVRFSGVLENFFLEPEKWVHIAWVKEGKKYTFYRNGYEFAQQKAPQKFYTDGGSYCIGKVDNGWVGFIDEVRIWDHARSEEDIRSDLAYRLSEDEKGLKGYWPLGREDEQISRELNKKSDAKIYGKNDALTKSFEPHGLAFGGKQDHLDLGRHLPLAGGFTIETWVNGSKGTIFQRDGETTRRGHIQLDFNKFLRFVDATDRSHRLEYEGIPRNEWAHVAASCNGKAMTVFVNGTAVASKAIESKPAASQASCVMGNGLNGSDGSGFKGRIDEFRIWNHARDASDLQSGMHKKLYGTESGLMTYLPFDEGFGQTSFDLAGRNNAKLRGPKWVEAPYIEMEGLKFDGVDDYLDCGVIMNPHDQHWSVELWFKWEGDSGQQVLYSKDDLFKAAVREGYFQYKWNPDRSWQGGTNLEVSKGEWVHAAVVYDGAEQTVYRDGEEVFSRSQIGPMGETSHPFIIGADGGAAQSSFKGQIHTVRIWNTALSEVEILTRRYENMRGNEPNLVGCWKLQKHVDEPYANLAAKDYSYRRGSGRPQLHDQREQAIDKILSGEELTSIDEKDSSFVIAGHSHLRLLDKNIFTGDVLVKDNLFAFKGELDLFLENSPLQVKGGLRGVITNRKFEFQGNMDVSLFTMTLVGGNVYLSNSGFLLKGILFDQSISLSLVKKDDALIEFKGALDKALVLGNVFRLCDPLDERKGPSLLISGPQPPAFLLRGQVELLGIKQSVVVAFKEDNFVAVLNGKIWNLFECRLTLTGRDLNKLGELSFEVIFINGLDELVYAVRDEINRILDQANDELEKAKGVVAETRTAVAKGLEAERARLVAEAEKRKKKFLDYKKRLDEELNRFSGQMKELKKQIDAESSKFSGQIAKAQRDLDNAKREVSTMLGEIRRTEKWYYSLPAVAWPLQRSQATEWIWVGPKIAGLYTAYGTAMLALDAVKVVLAGINELQKKATSDLQHLLDGAVIAKDAADKLRMQVEKELETLLANMQLIAVKITDAVAGTMFDLANGFLDVAQVTLQGIQAMCNTLLSFGGLPLKINSVSFAGKLGTAVGMVFEVDLNIDYKDIVSKKTVNQALRIVVDFNDLPKTAANLISLLFLPLAKKEQALIAAKVDMNKKVGKALSG